MNNEKYNEIIDEIYEDYLSGGDIKFLKPSEFVVNGMKLNVPMPYSKEELTEKIKTDNEFSDRWNIKIEERELTYTERYKLWFATNFETGMEYHEEIVPDFNNEYYDPTPTKLITITHKDEIIEVYE